MGILEVIFAAVIIIVLLILFGVPPASIITVTAAILLGLVALAMVLFVLFFIITDITLLFRRCVTGTFLRIEDTDRFDHAVYQVGDAEYSCIFPAESFGRRRIYHEGDSCTLLIYRNPKRRSAYDRHSLITIMIGTMSSVVFIVLLRAAALFLLSLM